MTRDEAWLRRSQIEDARDDPEMARMLENELWRDVLRTIRDPKMSNIIHARALATIALSTEDIEFARWYA